jgi:hypothetical protein
LIAPNGTSDAKEETFHQLYYILKIMVLNHGKPIHISQEPLKKLVHANIMKTPLYSKMDQFGTLLPKTQHI